MSRALRTMRYTFECVRSTYENSSQYRSLNHLRSLFKKKDQKVEERRLESNGVRLNDDYYEHLMDDYEQAELDYAEEGDKNQIPWAGIVIVGTIASCAFGLPICILPF